MVSSENKNWGKRPSTFQLGGSACLMITFISDSVGHTHSINLSWECGDWGINKNSSRIRQNSLWNYANVQIAPMIVASSECGWAQHQHFSQLYIHGGSQPERPSNRQSLGLAWSDSVWLWKERISSSSAVLLFSSWVAKSYSASQYTYIPVFNRSILTLTQSYDVTKQLWYWFSREW